MFDDLIEANGLYQAQFHDPGLVGRAARGLAVVTCIDSRIDPLAMLGLRPGDAKIIRNAGARITDDSLRSLILATNYLGVTRICVVQHTDCAMAGRTNDDIRAHLRSALGASADDWDFLTMADQVESLRDDLDRIAECPLIPPDVERGGFIFDVTTGRLDPVEI
jgi:carbonic anhydrase